MVMFGLIYIQIIQMSPGCFGKESLKVGINK